MGLPLSLLAIYCLSIYFHLSWPAPGIANRVEMALKLNCANNSLPREKYKNAQHTETSWNGNKVTLRQWNSLQRETLQSHEVLSIVERKRDTMKPGTYCHYETEKYCTYRAQPRQVAPMTACHEKRFSHEVLSSVKTRYLLLSPNLVKASSIISVYTSDTYGEDRLSLWNWKVLVARTRERKLYTFHFHKIGSGTYGDSAHVPSFLRETER